MSEHVLKFRRAITAAALAVAVVGGTLVYAGHVSAAKTTTAKNALHEVPAATGIDTSAALLW